MEPKCETCLFFNASNNPPHNTGRCKRHAPLGSDWPIVRAKEDWCGEYEKSKDAQPQAVDVGKTYLIDGERFLLTQYRKEDLVLTYGLKEQECFARFVKTG